MARTQVYKIMEPRYPLVLTKKALDSNIVRVNLNSIYKVQFRLIKIFTKSMFSES